MNRKNNQKYEDKGNTDKEKLYLASQWQLMWRKFRRHKLALVGASIMTIFYFVAIFTEFFAVYNIHKRYSDYIYCPPQRIHFFDENGFHLQPFVYKIEARENPETFATIYEEDRSNRLSVEFLVHGDPYDLWNWFEADIHLFNVNGGTLFLFGTDKLGRDLYSRNIHAARISLSIGLVGVALSFVIGCILGGFSGYYGGATDMIIQRAIELLISIPTIPLWMALAAALPTTWPPLKVYFAITIILSIMGWCGLARVVRGKLLELREEDFIMAAKIAGAREDRIITRHLLPSFLSYLIVHLTLAIPVMILGETALSFLGIGLRAPTVSWGVLLKEAQKVQVVASYPWLLIPGLFIIITVLAFNFLGDGLRDAADPYR